MSQPLFQSHSRRFESNRYVYPVLSRRAGGLSIGVNLNPDKICNFDCIYCQVDRRKPAPRERVDVGLLRTELDEMVGLATSGRIYEETRFRATPEALRRLNDIALSGDGEPTTCREFEEVVRICAEIRRVRALESLKLVLITNATMFDRAPVRRGLAILDANNGEIWAKLDAGTEAFYQEVARAAIPLARVLLNLVEAARVRPIVIQSLFMRIRGRPVPESEQEAYCDRLGEILAGGGRIGQVQIHTIARPPAESWVAPLAREEVDALADRVRRRTGLAVDAFYAP